MDIDVAHAAPKQAVAVDEVRYLRRRGGAAGAGGRGQGGKPWPEQADRCDDQSDNNNDTPG